MTHLLKRFKPSVFYRDLLKSLVIISFLLAVSDCGKRRPPQPPVERVRQRVELNGIQRGNIVTVSWTMPARNAPDGSILNIARVDVYRLAEPASSSLTLTEEEFAASSNLIASLPVENNDFALKKFSYTDTLVFADQPIRLRYAIRFVNRSGQKAAFSNFLLVEPTARVATAPQSLAAKVTETAIILNWTAPTENADGSKPANILGYNLYKTAKTAENPMLLNRSLIKDETFADKLFEFKRQYGYFVRAVSIGANGAPVESLNSNEIEVQPVDVFPPSQPTAVTVAAAPQTISLFFAVNPESDIAGYRIYRTTDRNLPKKDWKLLTTELLKFNTFQDSDVISGTTYYYYLIAVDTAGNESQPSETVSETVP